MSRKKSQQKDSQSLLKGNIRVSNNIVLAIVVVLTLVSLGSSIAVLLATNEYMPTGQISYDSEDGHARVYIGVPPEIIFVYPYNPCMVNKGNVPIIVQVGDVRGNDTIVNVSFFYMYFYPTGGSSEWEYIGSQTYDGDSVYNTNWNSLTVPDGYYAIRAWAIDNTNLSYSGYMWHQIINNINETPDWEEFKYDTSTNLSAMRSWYDITDLRIGNRYGQISYSDSGRRQTTVDGLNLSKYIEISRKKISLDPGFMPCLSKPAYLTYYNVSMRNVLVYRDGDICHYTLCEMVSDNNLKNVNVQIKVQEFSTYEISQNGILDIWDITDANRTPGNLTRRKNELVGFYANLTDGAELINDNYTKCFISFNATNMTGPFEMGVGSSNLFEYNRSFSVPGTYNWNVLCNSSDDRYMRFLSVDNVTIPNRPPRLLSEFPNITMQQDTTVLYVNDLLDYFSDPDGDTLYFNTSRMPYVSVRIVVNKMLITPQRGWYGERDFIITATDEFGLSNYSNLIHLTVTKRPNPPGGGGGGGGGGVWSGNNSDVVYIPYNCTERWVCSNWSRCQFKWNVVKYEDLMKNESLLLNERDGAMIRSCFDTNYCDRIWDKPNETQECVYQPTCNDLIKNQGEEAVDCGGPCPKCGSCFDEIQNQGEEAVDCGGPCTACKSCTDGIRNCHDGRCEQGVDCGGPCNNTCPEEEAPSEIKSVFMIPLILLLTAILLFTSYLFLKPHIEQILHAIKEFLNRKPAVPETLISELEVEYLAKLEWLRGRLDRGDAIDMIQQANALFRSFVVAAFEFKEALTYEELAARIQEEKISGRLKSKLAQVMREILKEEYRASESSAGEVSRKIDGYRELFDKIVEETTQRDEPKKEEASAEKKPAKRKLETLENRIKAVYSLGKAAKEYLGRVDLLSAIRDERVMIDTYRTLPTNERRKAEPYVASIESEVRKARGRGDKYRNIR